MNIKIMPDGYFIILLAVSIIVHFTFPIKEIPYPHSGIGLVLLLTGLVLVFSTNLLLTKKKTSLKPFKMPSALITSGPFKLSRNPIYLGMSILLFGAAFLLGSLSSFISPLLFIIILNKSIIPGEEHALEKTFGDKYLDYKKKVRRWL